MAGRFRKIIACRRDADPAEGARGEARAKDDRLPGEHRLSDEQRTIVALAAKQPLSILAGGPGTGKTFAARFVVERWRAEGVEDVALAAPTARGAAALGAAIGAKASTLHRLLEWQPREGEFARNARNPLECDAIIVDELSMLEAPLAAKLFAALPPHCKVLLVGDPDQPPVGPGARKGSTACRDAVPASHSLVFSGRARYWNLPMRTHRRTTPVLPETQKK